VKDEAHTGPVARAQRLKEFVYGLVCAARVVHLKPPARYLPNRTRQVVARNRAQKSRARRNCRHSTAPSYGRNMTLHLGGAQTRWAA
jgi:hypothetical protein